MLTPMTYLEKEAEIAKACRWTRVYIIEGDIGNFPSRVMGVPPNANHLPLDPIEAPHYTRSLDAMHEAEKTICGENFDTPLWLKYLTNLDRVVGKRQAHATAAHRSEAFRLTLNLWLRTRASKLSARGGWRLLSSPFFL